MPPATPTGAVLGWQFDRPARVSYDYRHTLLVDEGLEASMDGQGALVLVTDGSGTARIELKDLRMKMSMPGQPADEQNAPTMAFDGVREDGSLSEGDGNSFEMVLRFLFPLPNKALADGETMILPLVVPFDQNGTLIKASGVVRLTRRRTVACGDAVCAQLDSLIEVPGLDDKNSSSSLSIFGKGVVLFDLGKREVAASHVAAVFRLASGDMSMVQDHYISLTRN